jgi:enterochelin esterase family protein
VHNDRAISAHRQGLDYDVDYGETPDMHNVGWWRDALDPCLTGLLWRLWGADV